MTIFEPPAARLRLRRHWISRWFPLRWMRLALAMSAAVVAQGARSAPAGEPAAASAESNVSAGQPDMRPDSSPRIHLVLPTANDALFRGDMAAFYQAIERDFHDQISYPWEGGQYGFVRDPVDSPIGTIFTRFHEGIDIKPLVRDTRGEPLDPILAIDDGRVVHVSNQPGASNYGRYIVVEHRWDGCPYYSLYAHLSESAVSEGAVVSRGQTIARMGHTGEGIDRARSHVHLEINLMLNSHYDRMAAASDPSDPNKHGNFNGVNLAGFDVARFYLALRANPDLTVPAFLAAEEIYFRALVPAGAEPPDLLKLYPWMGNIPALSVSAKPPDPVPPARPASWEISFTRAGLPLRVQASPTAVKAAALSYAKPSAVPYWEMTHRLLYGAGTTPTLSPYGLRLVNLIGHTEGPSPVPVPSPPAPTPGPQGKRADQGGQ